MRRLAKLAAAVVVGLSAHAVSPASASPNASRALNQILPEVKFQGQSLRDCIDFLRDVSGANIHVNWRALEAAGVAQDTPVNVRMREVPLRKVLALILSESGAGGALTYFTADGVIEITTAEIADREMITRVYPIEDLIMEIPDFTNAPSFSLQGEGSGGSGGKGSKGGGGGRSGGGSGSSGGGSDLFGGGNKSAEKEKTTTRTERAEALVKMVQETIRPDIWRDAGGPASIRYYNGNLIVTAPRSVHEALGGRIE